MALPTDLLGRLCQGPQQLGDMGQGAPLVTLALHCEIILSADVCAYAFWIARLSLLPVIKRPALRAQRTAILIMHMLKVL